MTSSGGALEFRNGFLDIQLAVGPKTTGADMIDFDANTTSTFNNPMAGHANATDSDGGIRPYNISMIPIIVVS